MKSVKKLMGLCLLSSFLSGCVYYHSPNYRSPETPGQRVSDTRYGSLNTEGEAVKYNIGFVFDYDYRNGPRPEYPTGRDFTLTKEYSAFADSEEFKKNPTQFIPGYRRVSRFEYAGTWEFDKASCSLSLGNEETGFLVNMTGKVDRRYETVSGSGRYVTRMAYTVVESTLPELEGKVFQGKTSDFICRLDEYLKEHTL